MNTPLTFTRPRLGAWFTRRARTRLNYPYPDRAFVESAHHDLLGDMRALLRVGVGVMFVLLVYLGFSVAGAGLPSVVMTMLAPAVVWATLLYAPTSRSVAYAFMACHLRPAWSRTWLEAGVSPRRLAWVRASPIGPEEYATYRDALLADDTGNTGNTGDTGGTSEVLEEAHDETEADWLFQPNPRSVDPRLVWAMWERNITPALISSYRTRDIDPLAIMDLVDADITPPLWDTLLDDGIIPEKVRHAGTSAVEWTRIVWSRLDLIRWLRTTRAGVHPSAFVGPHQVLPVEAVLDIAHEWVLGLGKWDWYARLPAPCRYQGPVSSRARCACAQQAVHHDATKATDAHGGTLLCDWVRVAGSLTPFFLNTNIEIADAAAMLVNDPNLSAESLTMMRALESL